MALRKWHMTGSFVLYVGFLISYHFLFSQQDKFIPFDPLWVFTGYFMAMVGSEFPDWDFQVKQLQHRDIATHSNFISFIFVGLVLVSVTYFETSQTTASYVLIIAAFLIGLGSHLLLDLFPTYDPEKLLQERGVYKGLGYMIRAVIQGLTGKEIVMKMTGSYLIHFPIRIKGRKTLPLRLTRWWLFFNGLISIAFAYFLVYLYFTLP